jgi:hypothetical protein
LRGLLAATIGLLLLQAAARGEAGESRQPATWKRQEMEFVYLGFTTRYSCEGLQGKLRALLLASGARPDPQVRVRECPAAPGEVTEFPSVRMVFHAAVPASGPTSAQGGFAARWTAVTISARPGAALEPGDCELVEQFRDRVLPAFATRGLAGEVHCVPHRISGSSYRLAFESLQRVEAGPAEASH